MDKTCALPKYGGCGKTKALSAFSVCKHSAVDDSPQYRPRCKACMCKWLKRSKEEKAKMSIPQVKVYVGKQKMCLPVERGGCGKLLDPELFPKNGKSKRTGDVLRGPRCNKCRHIWQNLTAKDRETMYPTDGVGVKVSKRITDIVYTREDNYFFHMPATDCERNYWEVGRCAQS